MDLIAATRAVGWLVLRLRGLSQHVLSESAISGAKELPGDGGKLLFRYFIPWLVIMNMGKILEPYAISLLIISFRNPTVLDMKLLTIPLR